GEMVHALSAPGTQPDARARRGASGRGIGARPRGGSGQVLALFALLLLVLLGVSAVAIDYASWLLTDRYLQNVADHAAPAGASAFRDPVTGNSCPSTKCTNARIQAWTSLRDELKLVDDAGTPLGSAAGAVLAAGTRLHPARQPTRPHGGE